MKLDPIEVALGVLIFAAYIPVFLLAVFAVGVIA